MGESLCTHHCLRWQSLRAVQWWVHTKTITIHPCFHFSSSPQNKHVGVHGIEHAIWSQQWQRGLIFEVLLQAEERSSGRGFPMPGQSQDSLDLVGSVVTSEVRGGTFRSSWYLVILWTGLIRQEEMELARPCRCCISYRDENGHCQTQGDLCTYVF